MDQLARDIAAVIIIVGGLAVAYLEIRLCLACRKAYRWIYLYKALAGFACAILFTLSLLRLFSGGSDVVDPILGRPVFIITLTALALGAVHIHKHGGMC